MNEHMQSRRGNVETEMNHTLEMLEDIIKKPLCKVEIDCGLMLCKDHLASHLKVYTFTKLY